MRRLAPALLILPLLAACGPRQAPTTHPNGGGGASGHRPGKVIERGIASWYGPGFHGKQTANGETFDTGELTAAHKKLPFNTRVQVTNLDNGRSVVVRINDRGPFIRGRIIDLSRAAAEAVEMIGPGTARVELRLLDSAGRPAALPEILTVQVGAFADRVRAEALALKLEGVYGPTRIVTDADLHRVLVGTFGDRSKAEETLRRLRRDGLEGVVVQP
jgi:rare lipoprotein A